MSDARPPLEVASIARGAQKMAAQRLRVIHRALETTGRTEGAAMLEAEIAATELADAFARERPPLADD